MACGVDGSGTPAALDRLAGTCVEALRADATAAAAAPFVFRVLALFMFAANQFVTAVPKIAGGGEAVPDVLLTLMESVPPAVAAAVRAGLSALGSVCTCRHVRAAFPARGRVYGEAVEQTRAAAAVRTCSNVLHRYQPVLKDVLMVRRGTCAGCVRVFCHRVHCCACAGPRRWFFAGVCVPVRWRSPRGGCDSAGNSVCVSAGSGGAVS